MMHQTSKGKNKEEEREKFQGKSYTEQEIDQELVEVYRGFREDINLLKKGRDAIQNVDQKKVEINTRKRSIRTQLISYMGNEVPLNVAVKNANEEHTKHSQRKKSKDRVIKVRQGGKKRKRDEAQEEEANIRRIEEALVLDPTSEPPAHDLLCCENSELTPIIWPRQVEGMKESQYLQPNLSSITSLLKRMNGKDKAITILQPELMEKLMGNAKASVRFLLAASNIPSVSTRRCFRSLRFRHL